MVLVVIKPLVQGKLQVQRVTMLLFVAHGPAGHHCGRDASCA
jgi:hypothetical protein